MFIRKTTKFGKPIKIIHAGEFYITEKDELIGTLLGSCVAVCLFDSKSGIAGMNHFMLPGRISKVDIFKDRSAKYGITAINKLIEKLIKKGAERKNLVAKVFGGGSVLEYKGRETSIPQDNVRLAKIMLEMEDIPIIESDVGGSYTRKLLMDVKSGKVYQRKTTNKKLLDEVRLKEEEFALKRFKKGGTVRDKKN